MVGERGSMTPLRSIRLKCLDCMCGSSNEVKLCSDEECSLFTYRFGHNPKRKGLGGGGRPENFKKRQ